ncbi:ubiquitin carboxyl-terminal hydrolase MINDY-2-like [Clavelina lepadiformis]|uniref:Ubiquitin carboxyl-terminal hydrolase n=1 Tax=Clavelina lepadiformis TaxID=159417 RepID=A0ABP0FH21_CLALP
MPNQEGSSDTVDAVPITTPVSNNQTVVDEPAEDPCVYHIKWINWMNEKAPVITQNRNGPCPLLAIFNVLLLSKRVTLSSVLEMISSRQIMDYVGTLMFEDMPSDLPEPDRLNYEQNMSDAIAVFAKLQTGIDVNVQFKDVTSFECTSELAVFDILRIPLYHGWLPDPQDKDTCSITKNCSYNQLVDRIISSKESNDETVIRAGLVAEQYLTATASQLTCHGVVKILETMKDSQLAVFFRNNHFATLYKKQNELFTLVTDQGFLTKHNIVWETLSSVQGDTEFTDGNFLSTPLETPISSPDQNLSPEQQMEHDLQVALSLQDEGSSSTSPAHTSSCMSESTEEADRKLAQRLQEQYDQQAAAAVHSQGERVDHVHLRNPRSEQRQSDSKCVIL